jgi:hypothetical protein
MQLVTVSKISQQWNLMKERASEQATVSIPDNDTELKHLRIQGTSARDGNTTTTDDGHSLFHLLSPAVKSFVELYSERTNI